MIVARVDLDISEALAVIGEIKEGVAQEPILDEITAVLLNRIRTRFLSEVDPDGKPWLPSAAAIKRRKKGGTGTLFDTGRLFRSIQAAAVGPNQRRIYTDVPYAAAHNQGLGQVQRVFLGFGDEDIVIANRIAALRVQSLLSRRS